MTAIAVIFELLEDFIPGWPNTLGFFTMTLKYTQYIKEADVDAVLACMRAIRPLYDQYTPADIAEAHYQIRKELDMIVEREEKTKRIRRLKAELEGEDTE